MDLLDDVSKAPEELKQKMAAANYAFKRATSAQEQLKMWKNESVLAENALETTRNDLNAALDRWNPETNTMKELVSIPTPPSN